MIDLNRVYRTGWQPTDFQRLLPNLLVLRPLMRPAKTEGGIVLTEETQRWAKMMYIVEAHGELTRNPLGIERDCVITIRNALAEPIQESKLGVLEIVDAKYAWSLVATAAEVVAERERMAFAALAQASAEAVAKAEIQAERARLVAEQA